MENKANNLSQYIGSFVNRYLYTDIQPVGQIVAIKGKTTLIIKRVETGENKTKMEFIPGGFSAICLNQYEQDYDFKITEEVLEIRYSKQFLKQYGIDSEPRKYYDYNF
jgi:hypothetical protein